MSLSEHDAGKATGLAMVPKLKYEHIKLTSFSKMRVDLAAQVHTLSNMSWIICVSCVANGTV